MFSMPCPTSPASPPGTNVLQPITITPHVQYSSSIGVLGCKIDTNRVAYWPTAVSCDQMCVRVRANGRNVTLLKIDHSGGANDISYDAWNYLAIGQSATENPTQGGGFAAGWEPVSMSECAANLKGAGGKLPLSAANSMQFLNTCGDRTWAVQHAALYNIFDPVCKYGIDEVCTMPAIPSNLQPSCPSRLDKGVTTAYTGPPVKNIEYGTGKLVDA